MSLNLRYLRAKVNKKIFYVSLMNKNFPIHG